MTGLLEKDIRLILVRKSALLLFLVIGVIFTWEFSEAFSGAYITMLGAILAISTLSYDDTDNCMEFLFTLPCTKKQYVAEKYLFVYGFSFAAGVVGLIIIIVSSLINGVPLNGTMILEAIASELPIILVTGGILIPLQLKFGPERSRMVLLALIGVVFVLGFTVSKISAAVKAMSSLGDTLNAIHPLSALLVLIVILALLSSVSIKISMKILENREF